MSLLREIGLQWKGSVKQQNQEKGSNFNSSAWIFLSIKAWVLCTKKKKKPKKLIWFLNFMVPKNIAI